MSKFYFLVMNGEPIQPNEGDMVHELAVAETILDYLNTVCPDDEFDIAEAVFVDDEQRDDKASSNSALSTEDELFNNDLARLYWGAMVWSGE